MSKRKSYRLPSAIRPKHYSLSLTLNLNDFTFSGEVLIDAKVLEPTDTIMLHALDLQISHASVFPNYGKEELTIPTEAIVYDKEMETISLPLGKNLQLGQVAIKLRFSGEINDKMHGLYRTTYYVNGDKRVGAATQCESTHARRIFPCFDEPDMKASFSIKVTVPKHLEVLSNMPASAENIDEQSETKTVSYSLTPPMSTYLFALVAAELECLEEKDKNGVPIRIWTTPGKKEFGHFALECGLHTLPYFTDYFGIPYPLPKLDMVALPDFAHGAMENWGLITYRETNLLVDPANTSTQVKQRVAEVVDHEIAHMWFGNLVTMKWWDDLWLNEGFASYAGPLAIAHQFPEWNFWTQFNATALMVALHDDSSRYTHPIQVRVENPKDIGSIFDAISYSKGACLCRMLETALGDSFRSGVTQYLKDHAYGNARTDDLWKALAKASGRPVKKMMDQFTRQGGYPLLTLKEVDQGPEPYKISFTLTQRPFTLDGRIAKNNARRWKLPVAFSNKGRQTAFWQTIGETPERISIRCESESWIKLNFGQTGLYRVAYIDELWQKLARAAGSRELPEIDRLGLVDDALALARSGHLKTSGLLSFLSYLKSENNYAVWSAISRGYRAVENLIWDLPCEKKLRRFGQELFWPMTGTKGWNKGPHDNHLDVLKRSLLLYNLGVLGDLETIREAKKRFWDYSLGKGLDADIRQIVYSLAARYGGWPEMSALMSIYDKAELNEEKVRVLRAIGHFIDPAIINRTLEFVTSEKVRKQDHVIILSELGANSYARHSTWKFVKNNWDWLNENHGDDLNVLDRIIQGVAGKFKTAEDIRDVRRFLKTHKISGSERNFKQTIESIESNIRWLKRDEKDIENWVEKHEYGVPG